VLTTGLALVAGAAALWWRSKRPRSAGAHPGTPASTASPAAAAATAATVAASRISRWRAVRPRHAL
jgi:hypothetical protein